MVVTWTDWQDITQKGVNHKLFDFKAKMNCSCSEMVIVISNILESYLYLHDSSS